MLFRGYVAKLLVGLLFLTIIYTFYSKWSHRSLFSKFRAISVDYLVPQQKVPWKNADNLWVIYNRIPKTGGTSLVNLVRHIMSKKVAVVSFRAPGVRHLDLFSRQLLVRNLSQHYMETPLLFHGHFHYFNMESFDPSIKPVYINMVRDPLERLISRYYFLRFGDDFQPDKVRRQMKDPVERYRSFDDCVVKGGADCSELKLWVQVPFFCGHAYYCRIPGNTMALFTAKKRVVDDYLFVGLTEAFDKSIMLFEKLLPVFFTGALENLLKNSSKWQLRRSQGKRPVSKETLRYFQTSMIWRAENDFYQFVQHQFHATWSALDRDLQLYYPMNKENRISGVRYESIHRAAAPPPNDDT